MTNQNTISRTFIFIMALAIGVMVANLYYAQPLVHLISTSLNLSAAKSGLIVTATQIGYCLGVLFIVPLGDLVENKKLILTMLIVSIIALISLALTSTLIPYMIAALFVGVASSAVQIMVPYVTHFVDDLEKGKVVGTLMSGLMLGIILSRPTASFLANYFSWHAVFYFSAGIIILLFGLLFSNLKERIPEHPNTNYFGLILSMFSIIQKYEVLRRRGFYQACMFGAFSLFWTTVALYLTGPEFHLTQNSMALFALAGVAGAIVSPIAGKLADKGYSNTATITAMIMAACSFLIMKILPPGSTVSLLVLLLGANILDAGITANLVLSQRAIFSLEPKHRGRINGLFVAMIFVGGGIGSSLGVWAYAHGGWSMTIWIGFTLPILSLLYFLTEKKGS